MHDNAKAALVSGLGFGDEGKGTITEYLVHSLQSHLVIRYNGGPQASHMVTTNNGSHAFSQFGSGTLLAGAETFLSRYMIVNPLSIISEANHLAAMHCYDPLKRLHVDREALMTTQYHRAVNRIKEYVRDKQRHGTCGEGVGEVMSTYLKHKQLVPFVGDILDRAALVNKLNFIRGLKYDELLAQGIDISKLVDDDIQVPVNMLREPAEVAADRYNEIKARLQITDRTYLNDYFKKNPSESVVFEGAQGVLLDQAYGFQPHTTWTNITFDNALELLKECSFTGVIDRIGVTRTFSTRHGAGPLVTEDADGSAGPYEHNKLNPMQGAFRSGALDLVLLRYAARVLGGIDHVAITHMDMLQRRVCVGYELPADAPGISWFSADRRRLHPASVFPTYEDQAKINDTLAVAKPVYASLEYPDQIAENIEDAVGAYWSVLSFGPGLEHKSERHVPR